MTEVGFVKGQSDNLPKLDSFILTEFLAEIRGGKANLFECIFSREDADGWDVRQAMNDLAAYDCVPEPRIVIAGLNACRRLNDYALSVRFLEMVKDKCGNKVNTIWPYIVQEVCGTVADLGADFPEDLCYDKPELFKKSVFDM